MQTKQSNRQASAGDGKHRRCLHIEWLILAFLCTCLPISRSSNDGIDDDEILISFELYCKLYVRRVCVYFGFSFSPIVLFLSISIDFFSTNAFGGGVVVVVVYFTFIEAYKLVFPLQRVASIKFQFQNKA